MSENHACGPDHDTEFFDELFAVFDRYPEQANKYAISCMDHETDIMGIDFSRQAGIKTIVDDTVITEFVTLDDFEALKAKGKCCMWFKKKCFMIWKKKGD